MIVSAREIIIAHEKAEKARRENDPDSGPRRPVRGPNGFGYGYRPRTPKDPHDPTKLVPR